MKTYIALLRGINVGGHKKLKMIELKLLFEDLGFKNIITYIQSGNVVFSFAKKQDFSEMICNAIAEKYGWEVTVFVRTYREMKSVLQHSPFDDKKN